MSIYIKGINFNLNTQNRLNAYGFGIIYKDSNLNYIFIKKEIELCIKEISQAENNYLALKDTQNGNTDLKVIIGTYESITIFGSIGFLIFYYLKKR